MLSFFKFAAVPIIVASYVSAAANSLQQVTSFGTNPTNVGMYVYKPTGLAAKPALIVAIHYCTGTAQAYFSGTQYANLADNYKSFLVIYPNAPDSGGCWDVHSSATLTHNSGGDSLGIASMIRYAISNYNVDASRVYVTGTSSGAMMTSVLAGAYPDLFVAGSAWAGVPYSCFSGASLWNSACATGTISKTGQQWGDLVRNGYPGYTGARPKIQIWHGTQDETLNFNNFNEEIKQWTNVFGYSSSPSTSQSNNPLSGWTRMTYGPNFQAISAPTSHNIPVQETQVLTWFGLIGGSVTTVPGPTTTAGATTIDSSPGPSPTTNPGGQAHYGQCGGIGYTGPTACVSPYTCKYSNDWYSQCL